VFPKISSFSLIKANSSSAFFLSFSSLKVDKNSSFLKLANFSCASFSAAILSSLSFFLCSEAIFEAS
jgi:hypothetical protein